MTLDIKKMLVLSTGHISLETSQTIADVVAGSAINYGCSAGPMMRTARATSPTT